MILRNHGVLALGETVREAFEIMYYLDCACQIQVDALAGGMHNVQIMSRGGRATSRPRRFSGRCDPRPTRIGRRCCACSTAAASSTRSNEAHHRFQRLLRLVAERRVAATLELH